MFRLRRRRRHFYFPDENGEFGISQALKILARRAGVELKQLSPQAESAKNRLYGLLDLAARYYHKVLLDRRAPKHSAEYARDRGVSEESLLDFRLGYAVNEWDNACQFLRKKGYQEREIFEAGLCVKKERGSGYLDRFRDRLMFPIIDQHGRTVGIAAAPCARRGGQIHQYAADRDLQQNQCSTACTRPRSDQAPGSVRLGGRLYGRDPFAPGRHRQRRGHLGHGFDADQLKLIKRYANNLALALDMDGVSAPLCARLKSLWSMNLTLK